MSSIYVSTVIDAPIETVWATVEPVERHVDWMADAVAITFEGEQRRGVGTRFVCETRIGPIKLMDRMAITSWRDGREIGVRHAGLVTGTGVFTLVPAANGGTLFAWAEDLTFPWWLGSRLGGLVGGQLVLRAVWKRNLRTLKRLVESRATASPT